MDRDGRVDGVHGFAPAVTSPPPRFSATRNHDRSNVESGPFRYRAYGLTFLSSFPIPEMTEVDAASGHPDAEPDVTISIGSVPDHLEDSILAGSAYETNLEQLLLRIKGVGQYLVSGGRTIVVRPVDDADRHEVRVFLLGSCIGAILNQRGFLVLHASVIGTAGGAILFAGPSGAGKSTLLGELLARGHRMMVDDVCAVRFDDTDRPIVVPSYPRTRLWASAAEKLAIDVTGLPRTRATMEKFERQVPEQYWDLEAPLARLYHLTATDTDQFSITRLTPLEAFETVLRNGYRDMMLLDGFDRRPEHFAMASKVARCAVVSRVVRPIDGFRLQELADLIEQDLASGPG
jgi:hypothetical protein